MKKLVKVILAPPIVAVFATGGLLDWLTATEYKPAPVETVNNLHAYYAAGGL